MFKKIKKIMPAGMVAVGIFISLFMLICSRYIGPGYNSLLISEHLRECALVVLTECFAGAVAFKILLKKEKSSDRDFPQK